MTNPLEELTQETIDRAASTSRRQCEAVACAAKDRCLTPYSFTAQMLELDQGNRRKTIGTCPCSEFKPSIQLVDDDGTPISLG